MSKLKPVEIERLKNAGVEYPWTPRQSLELLDRIDRAIDASDNDGGSASDAIQDMLYTLTGGQ